MSRCTYMKTVLAQCDRSPSVMHTASVISNGSELYKHICNSLHTSFLTLQHIFIKHTSFITDTYLVSSMCIQITTQISRHNKSCDIIMSIMNAVIRFCHGMYTRIREGERESDNYWLSQWPNNCENHIKINKHRKVSPSDDDIWALFARGLGKQTKKWLNYQGRYTLERLSDSWPKLLK